MRKTQEAMEGVRSVAQYGMAFPFTYISLFFCLPKPDDALLRAFSSPYPALVITCLAVLAATLVRGRGAQRGSTPLSAAASNNPPAQPGAFVC